VALNARPAGLFRNRLNERTLLSWVQTNESLRTTDSSSPVIAVMQHEMRGYVRNGAMSNIELRQSKSYLME
jgi:hypothetical protein